MATQRVALEIKNVFEITKVFTGQEASYADGSGSWV